MIFLNSLVLLFYLIPKTKTSYKNTLSKENIQFKDKNNLPLL